MPAQLTSTSTFRSARRWPRSDSCPARIADVRGQGAPDAAPRILPATVSTPSSLREETTTWRRVAEGERDGFAESPARTADDGDLVFELDERRAAERSTTRPMTSAGGDGCWSWPTALLNPRTRCRGFSSASVTAAGEPELVAELVRRYEAIGGSPLLEITRWQAAALAERVVYRCWWALRLEDPSVEDALRQAAERGLQGSWSCRSRRSAFTSRQAAQRSRQAVGQRAPGSNSAAAFGRALGEEPELVHAQVR